MIEDAFGKTLIEGEAMRGRKINPRLPFLGAGVVDQVRRNPELHAYAPCTARPSSEALMMASSIVAQLGTGHG
jgi:hypothetical protein